MDVQSFILGMCAVLVIALVIGSVVALVKVIKLQKNFDETSNGTFKLIEDEKKEIVTMINEIHHRIDGVSKEIDSKYDKLQAKFSKETESLKQKNN